MRRLAFRVLDGLASICWKASWRLDRFAERFAPRPIDFTVNEVLRNAARQGFVERAAPHSHHDPRNKPN